MTKPEGMPEDIPRDVWEAANAADKDCQRNRCKEANCNGFLCAKALRVAVLAERERAAAIVEAYPPEGFNGELWEMTHRYSETDPFWKFEGDTGNWAALMGVILKPYAAAIRSPHNPKDAS